MPAKVDGQVVSVGEVVGFKSDIEQYGKITKIQRNNFAGWDLTLQAPDGGFSGDYIGGQDVTVERASDCWID